MNPEWNQTVIYKNIHLEQVLCRLTHLHTFISIHTHKDFQSVPLVQLQSRCGPSWVKWMSYTVIRILSSYYVLWAVLSISVQPLISTP